MNERINDIENRLNKALSLVSRIVATLSGTGEERRRRRKQGRVLKRGRFA